MRELVLRYAEILGHQNNKQKIKHVIKLKDQIYELKKVGSYCVAKIEYHLWNLQR
jgi:hypothetical protein